MRRLFKALAVLGMLLCFTLGAFAVSFAAHHSPSTWPRLTVELHRLPTSSATQLTQYAFRFGVGPEAGAIPNAPRLDLEEIRPAHAEFADPIHAPLVTRIHTPKVSLQILELVLLL
jgi:hypothetical protein